MRCERLAFGPVCTSVRSGCDAVPELDCAPRAASAWSEGSRSVRPFPLLAPGPLRAQAGSFGGASNARFGNGMYGLAFGTLPACSASFAAQPRSPKAMKPAASSSNRRRPRLRAIGAFNTQQSAATIRTTTPPRAIRQRAGPTILGNSTSLIQQRAAPLFSGNSISLGLTAHLGHRAYQSTLIGFRAAPALGVCAFARWCAPQWARAPRS